MFFRAFLNSIFLPDPTVPFFSKLDLIKGFGISITNQCFYYIVIPYLVCESCFANRSCAIRHCSEALLIRINSGLDCNDTLSSSPISVSQSAGAIPLSRVECTCHEIRMWFSYVSYCLTDPCMYIVYLSD